MGKLNKLIPCKTIIAVRDKEVNGKSETIKIYFGNYVTPKINGQYVLINDKKYIEMLNEFLNSEEGKTYQKPNANEIMIANRKAEEERQKHSSEVSSNIKQQNQSATNKPAQNMQVPLQNKREQTEKKSADISSVFGGSEQNQEKQTINRNSEAFKPQPRIIEEHQYISDKTEEEIKQQEIIDKANRIIENNELTKKNEKLKKELDKAQSKLEKSEIEHAIELEKTKIPKEQMMDEILSSVLPICLISCCIMVFIIMFLYIIK